MVDGVGMGDRRRGQGCDEIGGGAKVVMEIGAEDPRL